MEPNLPLYIFTLIAIFIYISLLSITKVVFTLVENYQNSLESQKELYLAQKINEILEHKVHFFASISFSKSLGSSAFAIILYHIIDNLNYNLVFHPAIISIIGSVLILSGPAYALPKALATVKNQSFIMLSYLFYQINRPISFIPASIMSWSYGIILKIFKYDEKLFFLTDAEKDLIHEKDTTSSEGLDEDEQAMIRNIFEFGESTVKEIMQPRIDIEGLEVSTDYSTVLKTISEAGHSRIPVFEGTIDSIIGILYAKDVLRWLSEKEESGENPEWNMRTILKKPFFVPSGKKLDDLMTDMKKAQSHMVIVVDEYGGTYGIATMEDILEEIVGEIQDEYDVDENELTLISERTYRVDPHIEIDDLSEKLPILIDLDDSNYSTLSGLVYHEYGEVPIEGTEFTFKMLHLKISKMDHQRIEEIILTLPESSGASEIDGSF